MVNDGNSCGYCPHRSGDQYPGRRPLPGGGVILDADADWVDATQELRQAYVAHPDLDLAVVGGFV